MCSEHRIQNTFNTFKFSPSCQATLRSWKNFAVTFAAQRVKPNTENKNVHYIFDQLLFFKVATVSFDDSLALAGLMFTSFIRLSPNSFQLTGKLSYRSTIRQIRCVTVTPGSFWLLNVSVFMCCVLLRQCYCTANSPLLVTHLVIYSAFQAAMWFNITITKTRHQNTLRAIWTGRIVMNSSFSSPGCHKQVFKTLTTHFRMSLLSPE